MLAAPIDVATWQADDFFATYPEGARNKKAFFPPDDCNLGFINKSRRYIFKQSDERYPEQFWCEIVAYHVGTMIGVPVPPAYPAIDTSRRVSAALIEWFYEDGETRFVAAGRYMQLMIDGFDIKTGRQHNFHDIRVLGRTFNFLHSKKQIVFQTPWLETWTKGLIFDALIGNTDRHQNNWGLLFHNTDPITVALSPWFDNGTSMGCDRAPAKVDAWPRDHFIQYLYNGQHHMRWERSSPDRCGLLEMPRRLIDLDANLRKPMWECLNSLDLDQVEALLKQCQESPGYIRLTPWRANFMLRLFRQRKALLLEVLS